MPATTPQTVAAPASASPRGRVIASVRQWIDSGKLAHGAALPSERDLARELSVARVTVRSALDQLVKHGVIEGVGTRTRRIFRAAAAARPDVLQRTVVVLSVWRQDIADPAIALKGWDTHVQLEATRALYGAGYHLLTINPMVLKPGELMGLTSQPFSSVLVTADAMRTDETRAFLAKCRQSRVPVVCYGGEPDLAAFDRVTSDHAQGAALLVRHLAQRGCRRIVRFWRFAGTPHWLQQRDAGYERAAAELGLGVLPAVRTPDLPFGEEPTQRRDPVVFEQITALLAGYLAPLFTGPTPPDALMTANDLHARQVAAACRRLHREPGRDVLITGYDNTHADDFERAFEPAGPDATIDKCNDKLAAQLGRLLVDRLAGKLPDQPQVRVVEPALVGLP